MSNNKQSEEQAARGNGGSGALVTLGFAQRDHEGGDQTQTEWFNAVFAWADPVHPRTVCTITPANVVSLRVAAKLGFREIARTEHKTKELVVFERHAR